LFFCEGPPKTKEKENNQQKNNPGKKQPTDFPPFFFGLNLNARRLCVDMPPHVVTRSWLWGLPLSIRASSLGWLLKGRQKKNRKTQPMYVRTLFGLDLFLTYDFVIVLIAFLNSLIKKRPKMQQRKSTKGKQIRPARPRKTFCITFLSSPYRDALNQRNKKVERKKS
jgi:hypothetical protein